jgi:hypothetical protein
VERVAFLIEDSGERVFAMINPDELTFERRSGVGVRRRDEMPLASTHRSDDPLIFVGGGVTDIKLNLLFDVDLMARSSPSFSQAPDFRTNLQAPPAVARSPVTVPGDDAPDAAPEIAVSQPSAQPSVTDVRDLSGPLWRLTENGDAGAPTAGPPVVYFIWGAAWNIPCIALSVAERFDQFAADGSPRRSWMRIHLRRTQLPTRAEPEPAPALISRRAAGGAAGEAQQPESVVLTDPTSSSRPDLLCDRLYGDMRLLHPLLRFNDIDDFWSLEPGRTLLTPPLSTLKGTLR